MYGEENEEDIGGNLFNNIEDNYLINYINHDVKQELDQSPKLIQQLSGNKNSLMQMDPINLNNQESIPNYIEHLKFQQMNGNFPKKETAPPYQNNYYDYAQQMNGFPNNNGGVQAQTQIQQQQQMQYYNPPNQNGGLIYNQMIQQNDNSKGNNNNNNNNYQKGQQQQQMQQQQQQLQGNKQNSNNNNKLNGANLMEGNKNLFNYKNNLKNTYINKISNLINDSSKSTKQKNLVNSSFDESNYSDNSSDEKGGNQLSNMTTGNGNESEKLHHKLARNRESARNSRKRKKIYIEMLEKKVENLSEELQRKNQMLQSSQEYLNNMNSQSQTLNKFIFGRQQLMDKLEQSLNNKADDGEINLLLDSLRLRLGATGKERSGAVNYFFKQILDVCFPTHFKYILWTSTEGKDIFDENFLSKINIEKPNNWREEFLKMMDLTEPQYKSVQKYRKKFVNEKQKLDELVEKLQEVKEMINLKASGIENMIDDFRNIFSPTQCARFLITLEKNKYRTELAHQSIWEPLKKNGDLNQISDDEGGLQANNFEEPRKKTKIVE